MSTFTVSVDAISNMAAQLREEAEQEPEAVPSGEVTKETQIIAIYGKGGIGKSFTLANLSYMMAQQGKKVLLIGCDPKSDTTSLLFGGRACPTIIETSSRKKQSGEQVEIGDVCFVRDGVYAMELGGPEVGRGCGGRGIIHGFELMEKLGFHDWDFDYVLLDFLGDVVCGGFGLPIARDMCQKVIVVASNDLQSLYVANNVCSRSRSTLSARVLTKLLIWLLTRPPVVATAVQRRCVQQPRLLENLKRSSAIARTTPSAHMISRRACARHSGRCV